MHILLNRSLCQRKVWIELQEWTSYCTPTRDRPAFFAEVSSRPEDSPTPAGMSSSAVPVDPFWPVIRIMVNVLISPSAIGLISSVAVISRILENPASMKVLHNPARSKT